MKILFCTLAMLMGVASARAQEEKTYVVPPGEKLTAVIPDTDLYTHPTFTDAIVTYRSGKMVRARMNYHKLLREMLFLLPSGDTLSLDTAPGIRVVHIGKDSFYFNDANGFALGRGGNEKARLLVQPVILLNRKEKNTGAYANVSTAAIESPRYITTNRQFRDFIASETLVFSSTKIYLIQAGDKMLPANKKNVLKLFPNQKAAIEKFLEEQSISFTSEESLQKLVAYLGML